MAAQSGLAEFGIKIESLEHEYPEIQADSSLEIARVSATVAAKESGKIVIREDHSLFVNYLGVPGPYMNYFERKVSKDKILEILSHANDRTGYFELALVCAFPDGKTIERVTKVPIYFKEKEIIGDRRGGWDAILCFEGDTRAFSEYPEAERLLVWNQNFTSIGDELSMM